MGRNRKYSSKFKAEVALEAIKGDKTISQIASEYGIHPQQVRIWRQEFPGRISVKKAEVSTRTVCL